MSYTTPARSSNHAPASGAEVGSPPPSFSRRVSGVSSVGGGPSPSVAGSERKRRTRIRDYYGLATPKEGHALDLDTPDHFDPESYFTSLTSSASLPDLLKREIELLNEIRELDGERQSLVYNHHHELIDASDTIRKMKSRAEALDTSLDALKTSFQHISQLSASLAPAPREDPKPVPPAVAISSPPQTPTQNRRTDVSLSESPNSPSPAPVDTAATAATSPSSRRPRSVSTATVTASTAHRAPSPAARAVAHFDPLVHLSALLALPILLRALVTSPRGVAADPESGKARADALWGSWEPALRSWEDAGVEGAREVGMECREVLRLGAQYVTSSDPASISARRASLGERRR